jgi:hypothetical protein
MIEKNALKLAKMPVPSTGGIEFEPLPAIVVTTPARVTLRRRLKPVVD